MSHNSKLRFYFFHQFIDSLSESDLDIKVGLDDTEQEASIIFTLESQRIQELTLYPEDGGEGRIVVRAISKIAPSSQLTQEQLSQFLISNSTLQAGYFCISEGHLCLTCFLEEKGPVACEKIHRLAKISDKFEQSLLGLDHN